MKPLSFWPDALYFKITMKQFFLIVCSALVLIAAPLAASSAAPTSATLSADEKQAALTKVETYLHDLKTAKARFLQSSPYGQALGTFYLKRPGRLRFEYDAPIKDFVVADGFFIYFYDGELEEQSNAPIGQTLADFILRDDLKLSGDVTVTDVSHSDALLHITLVQTDDPDSGSLTLSFAENPELSLKKWSVMDATGTETLVELFQLESGLDLPRELFVYRDPKHGTSESGLND